MITVRKARIDEVKKLQDLNDDAFASNPDFDPDLVLDWAQSELGRNYFTNTVADPNKLLLVAEDNEQLVGYLGASPKAIEYRKSNYVEIDNLGVANDYRRKGVATKLLEHFLTWAKEQGFQKISLSCYAKNNDAISFYQKSGFSEITICFEKEIV